MVVAVVDNANADVQSDLLHQENQFTHVSALNELCDASERDDGVQEQNWNNAPSLKL